MAKQKREKRRKNEIKTKTIQKLKLGMTAPTDLEFDDPELKGEEMFDLGEGEREVSRAGGRSLRDIVKDADGMSESEDEASGEIPAEEDEEEVLSSDEERERRTAQLEGALDSLYDDYRERMAERDAKYKVKQMRLKDRNFDSWHGIRDGSDSEDDGVDKGYRDQMVRVPRRGDNEEMSEAESEDGGWDVVAKQKATMDEADSDDSSDEDEAAADKPKRKSKITIRPDARAPVQPKRLLTTLTPDDSRAKMSRQAQVWFDQSMFKGVGDLAALDGPEEDEEEDEDEEMEEDDDEEGDDSDVEMESSLESTLEDEEEAEEEDDEFEIVPQEEDDEPEWDVDDEDQDEVLQKQIKSESLTTLLRDCANV